MEKYKICPVCHKKNSPIVLECVECGNDLIGVKIVDDKHTEALEVSTGNTTGFVRICDCGVENDLSARKCSGCGEDISDIIPSPSRMCNMQYSFYISSLDETFTFELSCPSEHVIGRENELSEYLHTKTFVSRRHAKLTVTEEGLFIENLSKVNGTYINNEKINDGIAYKLCAGDVIGLGGFTDCNGRQEAAAYFVVGRNNVHC